MVIPINVHHYIKGNYKGLTLLITTLSSIPMEVVDGVAPMVFNVPTEAGETHAHVRPGNLHAGNISIHIAEDGALDIGEVVQVPAGFDILVLLGSRSLGSLRKAASHLTGQ